jgi:hypothetical protein
MTDRAVGTQDFGHQTADQDELRPSTVVMHDPHQGRFRCGTGFPRPLGFIAH